MIQKNIADHQVITVKVIPKSKKTEYIGLLTDGSHKIKLKALPENGNANRELLHFLKNETGTDWGILSGNTGSRKILKKI